MKTKRKIAKLKTIEVDQSGKIEDTSKDTIIAFSNGVSGSLKIPSRIKRQLQEIFRREGKISVFIYRTFAAGLYFLLAKQFKSQEQIIVDREYTGHESQIKDIFLEFGSLNKSNLPNIIFGEIGKSSPAHKLASSVAHKKINATKTLSFEEIAVFAVKKDRASLRGPRAT